MAYYNQASNNRRLVQCYLQLEDYESLQTLASTISEGDPLCEVSFEIFDIRIALSVHCISSLILGHIQTTITASNNERR